MLQQYSFGNVHVFIEWFISPIYFFFINTQHNSSALKDLQLEKSVLKNCSTLTFCSSSSDGEVDVYKKQGGPKVGLNANG